MPAPAPPDTDLLVDALSAVAAPPAVDHPVSTAPGEHPDLETRILDAALGLVARWGVAKTGLTDIAKEAGCSRATVYRAFPGGKHDLFHRLGLRELTAYLGEIVAVIDEADDLDDALTGTLVVASRLTRDHDAAQFILAHEPGLLLPFLGFHEVERVYRGTAALVGPHLERFLPAERAAWAAEWSARIFLTFLFNPGDDGDLADKEAARRLVHRFLLPAFAADQFATSAPIPQPAPHHRSLHDHH